MITLPSEIGIKLVNITVIDVVQLVPIIRYRYEDGTEIVEFTGDMDVDCDGRGGNPHHDPYFQPDTRLHGMDGKPLWAEQEPFLVLPPAVLKRTKGIALGSYSEVTRLETGITAEAVAGDEGPKSKMGEGSPALCDALGLPNNPNSGGCSFFGIRYRIFIGKKAVIDGVEYPLQPA